MDQAGAGVQLYDDPNRFARPAGLELHRSSAILHGYQEFSLTRYAVRVSPEDEPLRRKRELLVPLFTPRTLSGRSVLDLGANGAFFCFWALLNGAGRCTAVDMDAEYVRMVEQARDALGFPHLEVERANVEDWARPADVVLALALIHWIYSCTAVHPTLDAAVGKLAALTRYLLVVEWVDPEDRAVASFGHIGWNPHLPRGPYDRATFEAALGAHFPRWRRIGDVSETRSLYAAYRTPRDLEGACPLPLLHPEETVIQTRRLTEHRGIEYWSRVYDLGERVEKQATLDLAEREGRILSRLSGPRFPRALGARSEGAYSVLTLEKVHGRALSSGGAAGNGAGSPPFGGILRGCLEILADLRAAGVVHRDIRPDNVLVRDDGPVLLDFGWAAADDEPLFAPQSLGVEGRPPWDGGFDDAYAMGMMLAPFAPPESPLGTIVRLMCEPEPSLRLRDPAVLRELVDAVSAEGSP